MRDAIGRPRPRCVPRNSRKGRSHENVRVSRYDLCRHGGKLNWLPIRPQVGLVEDRLGRDGRRNQLRGTRPALRHRQSTGCGRYGTSAFPVRNKPGGHARGKCCGDIGHFRRADDELSNDEQSNNDDARHDDTGDPFDRLTHRTSN
jgi:hypothetical protein